MRTSFTCLALAGLLLSGWPAPWACAQNLPPDPVARVPGLPFWHWQTPHPTGYYLTDAHPFTDSAALVAGNHGTLLYTPDAGQTWQPRNAGTTNDLLALSFAPGSQTGWMIYNTPKTNPVREGYYGPGEVRKTTDGGLTWVRQPTNSGEPYSARQIAIQAVSPTECYLLYAYYTYFAGGPLPGPDPDPARSIKHTTNGGLTWTKLPVPLISGQWVERLAFATASTGIVVGGENPGVCLRTTDHGQTWQDVRPRALRRIDDVRFTDATHGWLAGDTGAVSRQVVYRTADAGATWTPVPTQPGVPGVYVLTICPLDVQTCLVFTTDYAGPIFRTSDGGATWQVSLNFSLIGQAVSNNLRFTPSGHGWLLAGPYTRYSPDAGLTWQRRFRSVTYDTVSNYAYPVRRLHFPAPTHGRALGKPDELLRLDGGPGAAWRKQSLRGIAGINWATGGFVLDADFPDQDTTHLLVQDLGMFDYRYWAVRLTGPAGAPQASVVPLPLTSAQVGFTPPQLRFRDGRHGVLTVADGLVLVTQDAGQSWQQPPLGTTTTMHTVAWADDTTVYVAGDSARIYRSTDAGQSWRRHGADSITYTPNGVQYFTTPFQPVYYSFYDLFFTDATTGYWGDRNIFRTRDGGRRWRQPLFLQILYPMLISPYGRDPVLRGIRAGYNPRHLWAFGGDQLRSGDGGATWDIIGPTRIGATLNPHACAAIDKYNAYVSLEGGVLRYSEKFIQTDTAASQRLAYCTGDTATVAFDTTGIFSPAERNFRVELSNRMGRFRPRETTLLPLLAGSGAASPLRAVLPAGLAGGSRYRLRVIRADSSVLGGDNERDLTIYPRPAAVAVQPLDSVRLCAGDSVQLTAPAGFGQYQWSTGATTAGVWVRAAGAYSVQVAAGGGCFGPASPPVTVHVTPRPAAPTLTSAQTGSGPVLLSAAPLVPGATYVWTGPGGVVAGASGPTLLLTAAAQNGLYSVTVTAGGCASPPSAPVNVTITGLREDITDSALTLHPNPADASVTLTSTDAVRTVAVRDLAGREVARVADVGGEPVTVPVAALPAGVYLVHVTLADGRTGHRRLLIEH